MFLLFLKNMTKLEIFSQASAEHRDVMFDSIFFRTFYETIQNYAVFNSDL
jgi:hypothetical protein